MTKKTIEFEIKSSVGKVAKDTGKLADNSKRAAKEVKKTGDNAADSAKDFRLMGVSINSLKGGFKSAKLGAKAMFGTIKAGMISTGIGALIVLFGSLMTYMLNTEEGMRKLTRVFKQFSSGVNVIKDRISAFGKVVSNVFNKSLEETINDTKKAFAGTADEIAREVKLAGELSDALDVVKDKTLDIRKKTAETRLETEKYKKAAEDTTLTLKERLDFAEKAYKLEADLVKDRLAVADEEIRIQTELNNMSNSMYHDEELLIELIEKRNGIELESTTKSIELQNKKNALKLAENAIIQKNIDDEQARIDQELEDADKLKEEKLQKEQDYLNKMADIYSQAEATMDEKNANALLAAEEARHQTVLSQIDAMKLEEAEKVALKLAAGEVNVMNQESLANMEKQIAKEKNQAIQFASMDLAKALIGLAGENKMLASASVVIDTAKGVMKAYGQGGVLGGIGAAVVIAQGIKSLKDINATPIQASGGGNISSVISNVQAAPPSPSMSGRFNLNNKAKQEPIEAYVVTDKITKSQSQLGEIRKRATI